MLHNYTNTAIADLRIYTTSSDIRTIVIVVNFDYRLALFHTSLLIDTVVVLLTMLQLV